MSNGVTLRLLQEVTDTYRLSKIGGYFYLAGWLVVAIYSNAFVHSKVLAWTLSVSFLGLVIARRLHRPPQDNADDSILNTWLLWHWGIVLATATLFGFVFFWTFNKAEFAQGHTPALLSTMGLAVAIAHAFAMRLHYSLLCVAILYLPGTIALWLSPEDSSSALVMSIYLIFVVTTLWRSHHEYQHHLDIDQQLRDQCDLFEQQGRIDALTGLANRRFFTELLTSMSQNAQGTGKLLVLMVLDLDHFKNINDQYGHAVGDICLSTFALRLKEKFSDEGVRAARLGGEEFGVLLQEQSLDIAIRRAEEFRSMCAREPIQVGSVVIPMTVSIGVARFDSEGHGDGDALYRAADSAAYQAKHLGRNRVCGLKLNVV